MLDNAAKWSPRRRHGRGRRSTAAASPSATTGPGFAAGDLDKVFDRFWRADEARGMPGSGLGLAIVAAGRRGARRHARGPRTPPDGGAVVSLELPETADSP